MKRYRPHYSPYSPIVGMKESDTGEWVRYSDHLEDKIRTLEGFRKAIEPLDPARNLWPMPPGYISGEHGDSTGTAKTNDAR